jgi:transposase
MNRPEIITVERRRRWSAADKRRIVAAARAPGASVSAVARQHGMHPSQLFAWRRMMRSDLTGGDVASRSVVVGGFAAVEIAGARPEASCQPPPQAEAGRMEIVLAHGRRLIVDAAVDATALGRVLDVLERLERR